MIRNCFCICFIILVFVSCSRKITSPSFIDFKVENDSIYVISKNKLHCPLYVKVIHRKTNKEILNQLESKEESVILKYPKNEIDSNKILKRYKFAGYYGRYPYQENDTNQMYTLPFQKGYESLVIQGYDGDFSHHGSFSAKCLDFEMAVGDTIVAAKDGIVVKIVSEHNKQGTTESFKKYGNYVMLYHKNNTFSQYVHIKQYGNLVKVGDSVKAKQPIALSGFTGWTTSPHLHFGVYKPEVNGLESIPIILDSIPAKNIKRGHILTKN